MERQRLTWLAAGLAATAALGAIAATLAAQAGPVSPRAVPAKAALAKAARAGTVAERGSHAARAAALPSCPTATVCVFSGADATGTEEQFPTSQHHSAWMQFSSVVDFTPKSIIDNSGSDIWVFDSTDSLAADHIAGPNAGPYCAFGTSQRDYTFSDWVPTGLHTANQGYQAVPYQPDEFFIQYNVNDCQTQPTGE